MNPWPTRVRAWQAWHTLGAWRARGTQGAWHAQGVCVCVVYFFLLKLKFQGKFYSSHIFQLAEVCFFIVLLNLTGKENGMVAITILWLTNQNYSFSYGCIQACQTEPDCNLSSTIKGK